MIPPSTEVLFMLLRPFSAAALTFSCLAVCAAPPVSLAQRGHSGPTGAHPATQQPYTIPVTVRRVVLDVVVTDSKNNAVHGLTAHDFSVFENNKQQPIKSFEAISFNPPRPT